MTVAVGGFGADNHPMAIVREIIRNGTKKSHVIASATAGLEIDLLIGAGCVKKLIAPYVGPGDVLPDRTQLDANTPSPAQIEMWSPASTCFMPACLPRPRARNSLPGAAASAPASPN